jgi:hypothetical protein
MNGYDPQANYVKKVYIDDLGFVNAEVHHGKRMVASNFWQIVFNSAKNRTRKLKKAHKWADVNLKAVQDGNEC